MDIGTSEVIAGTALLVSIGSLVQRLSGALDSRVGALEVRIASLGTSHSSHAATLDEIRADVREVRRLLGGRASTHEEDPPRRA